MEVIKMGLEEKAASELRKEENLSEKYDRIRKERMERIYGGKKQDPLAECLSMAYCCFLIKGW